MANILNKVSTMTTLFQNDIELNKVYISTESRLIYIFNKVSYLEPGCLRSRLPTVWEVRPYRPTMLKNSPAEIAHFHIEIEELSGILTKMSFGGFEVIAGQPFFNEILRDSVHFK